MWWNKKEEANTEQIDSLSKQMRIIAKKAIDSAVQNLENKVKSVYDLNQEIETLNKEIKELGLQKTMDEREVKQLVKIKLEQGEIDYQKKEIELKNEFADKEQALMQEYHDKQISFLETAREEMKEMHDNILERLPNLQATLELAAGQGSKKETKEENK